MGRLLKGANGTAKLTVFDESLVVKKGKRYRMPEKQLEKEKHMLFKQNKAGIISEKEYVVKLKRAYEKYNCAIEDFESENY